MRSKIWKRFSRDSRGTIAVLFGFSASVLFVMIGVAVDAARVYSLNDKVRSTLDSAALAGAKLLDDQGADVIEAAPGVPADLGEAAPLEVGAGDEAHCLADVRIGHQQRVNFGQEGCLLRQQGQRLAADRDRDHRSRVTPRACATPRRAARSGCA